MQTMNSFVRESIPVVIDYFKELAVLYNILN